MNTDIHSSHKGADYIVNWKVVSLKEKRYAKRELKGPTDHLWLLGVSLTNPARL